MTTHAKKTVLSDMADMAAETSFLAATAQQAMCDALRMEIGAIEALVPRATAAAANRSPSHAARRAVETECEAMFDNMPV
jgi:hypothetical protein